MAKRPKRKGLINKLDKVFSELIRQRGACERCGNTQTLQTSHIYSRTYQYLRWDEENAHCLCAKCHFWWHKNPAEAGEFLLTTHGSDRVAELKRRRNMVVKRTDNELQALYEDLKRKVDQNNRGTFNP